MLYLIDFACERRRGKHIEAFGQGFEADALATIGGREHHCAEGVIYLDGRALRDAGQVDGGARGIGVDRSRGGAVGGVDAFLLMREESDREGAGAAVFGDVVNLETLFGSAVGEVGVGVRRRSERLPAAGLGEIAIRRAVEKL